MNPHRRLLLTSIAASAATPLPAMAFWDEPSVETIRVADLPLWRGDPKTLRWLTPRRFRSTADGPAPDVRLGVQSFPTVLHHFALPMVRRADRPAPLVGGWEVEVNRLDSCLQHDLNLHHRPTGRRVTWVVEKDREAGFVSRRLSCIGGGATVYFAVLLNERYFAFLTDEPGWVFLDRLEGRFLPLVVGTNPNHGSNLYLTPQGQVLVDIDVDPKGTTHATNIDRQADGIRQVVFKGQPLIAPFDMREIAELKAANKRADCWIEQDNGRTCQP